MRQAIRSSILAALFLAFTVPLALAETTLFESNGFAVAYISDDLTVYLWAGDAVAYLEPDRAGGFHLYGFNGEHLGWYAAGVVRDHAGHAVGANRAALSRPTLPEPFKPPKKIKPFKANGSPAPFPRPVFIDKWSGMRLREFLLQGSWSRKGLKPPSK